jgi:hypothetical protein
VRSAQRGVNRGVDLLSQELGQTDSARSSSGANAYASAFSSHPSFLSYSCFAPLQRRRFRRSKARCLFRPCHVRGSVIWRTGSDDNLAPSSGREHTVQFPQNNGFVSATGHAGRRELAGPHSGTCCLSTKSESDSTHTGDESVRYLMAEMDDRR